MKHPVVWFSVSSVVVLFVGYLALTAGTRFFLPKEIGEIEPGMHYDEVRDSILADWVFQSDLPPMSGLRIPVGPEPPREYHDFWHIAGLREMTLHLKGPLALRNWEIGVEFSENGKVERVHHHATDWHERAYEQARYWVEKKWQSLR
ncbi:MAG: hypothetical protein CMO55_12365 [Verrucomicrobiales bacterium]|nr:hypothetical protein [Verrucomicrobiales bacterium]